jgi:hypothetical protein
MHDDIICKITINNYYLKYLSLKDVYILQELETRRDVLAQAEAYEEAAKKIYEVFIS